MTATPTASLVDQNTARVARLIGASARRVIEPDVDVTGHLTKAQVLPDELLSIAGLDLDLTGAERATLAREELASIVGFGIRFEAVLMAGFASQLALSRDMTDPRYIYALHEIGEETRHSRLFIRVLDELAPRQRDPLNHPLVARFASGLLRWLVRRPATLDALVLAGEEIPDLFQKLAAEHPDTDDYIRKISRYHRLEEARHLAFARTTIGEHYRHTTRTDRFAVRWIAPIVITAMFDTIVQPFVYSTVGLDAIPTWLRVRRHPARVDLRQQCGRAVLNALIDARVFSTPHIPPLWRHIADTDRHGNPRLRHPDTKTNPTTPTRSALANLGNAAALLSQPVKSAIRQTLAAANLAVTPARRSRE